MANLYKNYPEGMKDAEIIKCVREYTDEIIQSGAQVNTVWQLTPLIQLGQYELEKRQSMRITRLTIGVSIVSMFIAVVALWIALESNRDSNSWKQSQLGVLEDIQAKLGGELTVVLKSPPAQIFDRHGKVVQKPPTSKAQPNASPAKNTIQPPDNKKN